MFAVIKTLRETIVAQYEIKSHSSSRSAVQYGPVSRTIWANAGEQ